MAKKKMSRRAKVILLLIILFVVYMAIYIAYYRLDYTLYVRYFSPVWSPEGDQFAYAVRHTLEAPSIYYSILSFGVGYGGGGWYITKRWEKVCIVVADRDGREQRVIGKFRFGGNSWFFPKKQIPELGGSVSYRGKDFPPVQLSWLLNGRIMVSFDSHSKNVWQMNPDGSGLKEIEGISSDSSWFLSASPDGQWLVFMDTENRILVRSIMSQVIYKYYTIAEEGRFPSWNPLDNRIVYTVMESKKKKKETIEEPTGIAIYNFATKEIEQVIPGEPAGPVRWWPDGQSIYTNPSTKFNLDTIEEEKTGIVGEEGDIISPDLSRLLREKKRYYKGEESSYKGEIEILDREGQLIKRLSPQNYRSHFLPPFWAYEKH